MKEVAWGLIGCGDISRKRVAPALRDIEESNFLAISRKQADKLDEFAREYDVPRTYPSWRDLVSDVDIDAVYVATPVNLHCEQTVAAAEAGKHVLCEKPMAMTVAECDRMIDACRTNGVKLGVAYYRHFYPVVKRIRQIIGEGDIGTVVTAQINAYEWFNPGPGHPRYWFMIPEQAGGGPMFDFGCHRIEVLLHILGPVGETVSMLDTIAFDREVEDTGTALFRFTSGVHGVLSVTHAAVEPQDTLHIFGTGGSLHVPVLNEGTLRIVTPDGERIEEHPPHDNIHLPLIDDFTCAVMDDRRPGVDGIIGRTVNEVEEAIFR